MPTVKIELIEGLEKQTLINMRDAVSDAIVNCLQMPNDDRNVRIIEYKEDFFIMRKPYEILIEICMFSGRTKETKKKLFNEIANNIESIGIDKNKIMIMFNEQPAGNWGLNGGQPADETALDFKIEI